VYKRQLLLALLELGAIPVVVDPGMGLRNVLKCIGQIKPRGVLAIPAVHAVRTLVRKPFRASEVFITHGRKLFWGGTTTAACLEPAPPLPAAEFSADDEAFIVFTSGSTGTPKGVSFRHGMFAAATRLCETELDFGPGNISLETFAPFVLLHLAAGETVVVPEMDLSKPALADGAKIVHAITTHRPQLAFASPVVLRKVMDHCQKTGTKLDSLTLVLTGVAPIPGDLHRGLVPFLGPGGRISVNYGATEALMACSIDTPEILGETWAKTAKGHGNCVGTPYPGIDVRVIRTDDAAIPVWSDDLRVTNGQIGEIVVAGPLTSPEYKDLPEANAKAKIDEDGQILHRMGDLGYFDDHGRLWFCGRKAHRIQMGSKMVPNVPLEGVFNEHPAVLRSALVGVGPSFDQTPVLCVELKPGKTLDDDDVAELLSMADSTRWPGIVKKVLVHPGFPMDARHNSKIRNEDLQAWAAKKLGTSLTRS
jgi:acyl-coenzyme A synthetase/AMP-(fatty) acid ligase